MRYTQPQGGPARIDWGNPLARGLAAAFLPLPGGGMLEVVSGVLGTPVNTPTRVLNRNGIAVAGDNSNRYSFASTDALNVTGPLSIISVGRNTNTHTFIGKGSAGSLRVPYYFQREFTNTPVLYRGGASDYEAFDHGTAPTLDSSLSVVGVSNNGLLGTGSPARYYLNGVAYPVTGGSMVDSVATANSTAVTVGGMAEANLVLLYARELSDSEHARLAANPWQVFKGKTVPLSGTPATGANLARGLDPCTAAAAGGVAVSAAASLAAGALAISAAATVPPLPHATLVATLGSVGLAANAMNLAALASGALCVLRRHSIDRVMKRTAP